MRTTGLEGKWIEFQQGIAKRQKKGKGMVLDIAPVTGAQ